MPGQDHDHDLLIRLDENIRGMAAEIKLLRDGTFDRIGQLEKNKLDADAFNSFKTENDKAISALFEKANEQSKKSDKQSYILYTGVGIVVTLQFIGLLVASAKW